MDNLNSNITPLTINGTIKGGKINGQLADNHTLQISNLSIPTRIQGRAVVSHTSAEWAEMITYVSEKDVIYVYTDHQRVDETDIPGIKIGDGNAYVIDLPFIDEVYARHIADRVLHITQEERDFWNNKVTCYIDPLQEDKLIFSKN